MKSAQTLSNRDALLLAAKKCLLEKGYSRTTARDIASTARVSLAAIGYHFSSKEALLTEALLLAFGEWDEDLQRALRTAVPSNVAPAERFEATWAKMIATFETHRPLWIANFEIFAQMVGQPATREMIAGTACGARWIGGDVSESGRKHDQRSNGADDRHLPPCAAIRLVLQWLIDPASALSAKDLTKSLRATAES